MKQLKNMRPVTHRVTRRKEKRNACPYCRRKFTNLQAHMRIHTGLKPFPCAVCGKGFSRIGYLQAHACECPALKGPNLVDEKDEDEEEEEEEVKRKDKEVKAKVRHVEEQSSADEKFDCPECGKVLSSKINLRGRGIECPDCDKNFGRGSDTRRHEGWPAKNASSLSGEDIARTECGEVFPNTLECLPRVNTFYKKMDRQVAPLKLKLNVAKRAEAGDMLKCKLCDMFFTYQGNLSSHMARKHPGRRPFACPRCKKTYATAYNMNAHTQYAHSANKRFACKHCHKSYTYRSHLKTHMKMHNKLESNSNPFLEEDEDDAMVVDEEAKDVEPKEKDMEVESCSLRRQLSEQKRRYEAQLERVFEEQRCVANKTIGIYKNALEKAQEENASLRGAKCVIKDMSSQLLTKDQALSEYRHQIIKYRKCFRRIEDKETVLRIALEALENGKKGQVNGTSQVEEEAVEDGESESDAVTTDRCLLKRKVKSSWIKLSNCIRNMSNMSTKLENDP